MRGDLLFNIVLLVCSIHWILLGIYMLIKLFCIFFFPDLELPDIKFNGISTEVVR